MKAVFLKRALATETLDYSDEGDAPEASCPVCQDREYSETSAYRYLLSYILSLCWQHWKGLTLWS